MTISSSKQFLRRWPQTWGLAAFMAATTMAAGLAVTVPTKAEAAPAVSASHDAIKVATTQSKGSAFVPQSLRDALVDGKTPAVVVRFRGKADLSAAFDIIDSTERATYVYETLRDFAASAQAQTRQTLTQQFNLSTDRHEFTILWVDNSIAIERLTQSVLRQGHLHLHRAVLGRRRALFRSRFRRGLWRGQGRSHAAL